MKNLLAKAELKIAIQKATSLMTSDELINKMQMALNNVWEKEARAAIIDSLNMVRQAETLGKSELAIIESNLALRLGVPIGALAVQATTDISTGAFLNGTEKATQKPEFLFNTDNLDALNAVERNNNMFASDHYSEQLAKATKDALRPFFAGQSSTSDVAFKIRNAMGDKLLKSDAYWKTFAEQSIIQTRSIGQVAGYQREGIETIRVKAVIDERTSMICMRLNGTIISVKNLSNQVANWQKAVNRGDKQGMKDAWPWWGDKQAAKLTSQSKINKAVKQGKVGSPPYHGRCRTTTVVEFVGNPGQKILTPTEKKKMSDIEASRVKTQKPVKVTGKKPVKITAPKAPKLTSNEEAWLNGYTGDDFLKINKGLNSGNIDRIKGNVKGIDSALKKFPDYKGQVNRTVNLNSQKDLDSFLSSYSKNGPVRYDQYLSTSSGDLYGGDIGGKFRVNMDIKSKTGKDISNFSRNKTENEVLFGRGSQFKVTEVNVGSGKYGETNIKMEEI